MYLKILKSLLQQMNQSNPEAEAIDAEEETPEAVATF